MEFITRPDGLQYHIEKEGSGNQTPSPGDVVEVHYTGWLDQAGSQGKKFDSSHDRGRPFSFVVGMGQVIKGWDETLLEMHEGEIRYIILPPQLGYGAHGAGAVIPPHATLRFQVELLKIHAPSKLS
jgi:FKBP-type peptidyl-prolyl cis-trans isomerase